jgi:GNAT superfamily N-acetyltransferase
VARDHVGRLLTTFEGAETRHGDSGVLALTGYPLADFNMCLVGAGPDALPFLRDAVGRIRERSLSAVLFVSAALAPQAEAVASDLNLTSAGEAPLMIFDGSPPSRPGGFDIVEATSSADLDAASALVSAAFDLPAEWVARWFDPRHWSGAAARCFVAKKGGAAMSTVEVTGPGDDAWAGIWTMATPPEHQRQGAGRAVLLEAMRLAQQAGARRFYLMATPAGKPLYESVGFRTLEEFPLYVVT